MIKNFIQTAGKQPNSIAIVDGVKSYSYRQLLEMSNAVAYSIQASNSDSKHVGLYTDNNVYSYAAMLGILMAGKAFVPLNNKFSDDRLLKIVETAEIELILGCESSYDRMNYLSKNGGAISIDRINLQVPSVPFDIDMSRLAYILFTSGTTGEPKGIPITLRNFSSFLASLMERYPLDNTNKVLQGFELSFDVSLGCTFLALSSGSQLVLSPLEGIVAVNIFKTILDNSVDFVTIAPSAVTYMKNYKLIPQFKLPFVKTTIFTGEALPYDKVEQWMESVPNSIVDNGYGPTEATVWSYFYRIDQDTERQTVNGLCPIGDPLNGVKIKIVPTEGQLDKGELLLSGDHVFEAYWNDAKNTQRVFQTDKLGVKWYMTRDLVYLNDDGNLIYINRLDNQVKINGYRIELGEIEHAIKKELPGHNAVVVVAEDKSKNKELIAFVDCEVEINFLNDKLSSDLTFYMLPKEYITVKNFPINTNGKIDRKSLTKKADDARY